jgi:hypothetical protein
MPLMHNEARPFDQPVGEFAAMAAEAVFGFVGVILGSVSTVILTVYREQLVSKRERDMRHDQREQERKDQRDSFQRKSILALQGAVSDLVKAVFDEQDRMLTVMEQTNIWPARRWETPTAIGWVDAEQRLQVSRARVFGEELRNLAGELRAVAMKSVWATSLDEAKSLNLQLEQLHVRFNDVVSQSLPELY